MQVLSIGSRGAEVMFLQRLLNKHGANPYVTEDGAFGPRTQSALIAYQRAHRVTAPPLVTPGDPRTLRLATPPAAAGTPRIA